MHSRGLYVQTENELVIDILMVSPDGKEERISNINPSRDLIAAMEMDYSLYRGEVVELYNLPLFAPKLDIDYREYRELVRTAWFLPELIQNIDPIGAFVVRQRIKLITQRPDDGSASYWLYSGQHIIQALMEPVLTQLRLKNIFEVTFANTERKTQAERYRVLRQTYPQLFEYYFRMIHLPTEEGTMPYSNRVEYAINTLLEFRMLELDMYFRQPNRIARCGHCWHYFIPKTKKETLYCDRVWEDGRTCKQLGPNAQRRIDQQNDNALAIFEVLRKRMTARCERYMDSCERMDTEYALNLDNYLLWCEESSQVRTAYLDGKITAEEFIRRIDMYGELKDFVAEKINEDTGESVLERLVRNNLDFDPAQRYCNIQTLDLGEPNPEWKTVTAEEWMRQEQGSHRPLVERAAEITK